MTKRGIDKMEKAKWLLIEAMEEATSSKEAERIEKIIVKIEVMQNSVNIQ